MAKLYGVKNDAINFVAPENMVFHLGVEQTSWNIIVHVYAPKKVSARQEQVAKLIFKEIGEIAINKTVEFYYYSQGDRYVELNDDYPRFISEANLVKCESAQYEGKSEGENDDEIFTGDIFETLKG
ncbi:MAG: hypothetical protein GX813_04330 [Erysipelotrichia bacterium]|nr:hypothetical protein [Erysipelotrichia bacterium]